MDSVLLADPLRVSPPAAPPPCFLHRKMAAPLLRRPRLASPALFGFFSQSATVSVGGVGGCLGLAVVIAARGAMTANFTPARNGVYTVGDFMTGREDLHVVKPTTTIDDALEALVENRITGFPVIDDDWNLVGVVSDYDLLALDSISGNGHANTSIFPEADSTWKTFNEVQKLLSKTNGKVISDVMTTSPLVVRDTTNLEDAARLLLETKYRRLPVVDGSGNLVGIITRGNVVRAALQMKRFAER